MVDSNSLFRCTFDPEMEGFSSGFIHINNIESEIQIRYYRMD